MIYVAQPYTGNEVKNYEFALEYMVDKLETHFSPIMYSHMIAELHELPKDWNFWENIDRVWLSRASDLEVLMIPGWDESKGVKAEMEYFGSADMIDVMTPRMFNDCGPQLRTEVRSTCGESCFVDLSTGKHWVGGCGPWVPWHGELAETDQRAVGCFVDGRILSDIQTLSGAMLAFDLEGGYVEWTN